MGQYDKKGTYSGYKKNNKEREELDYYATPTKEVLNILETEHLLDGVGDTISSFNHLGPYTILEPCCGGGHMLQGICDYNKKCELKLNITARDIKDRKPYELVKPNEYINIEYDFGKDFLSDDYPDEKYDFVIMNPPFSTIEPFVQRALELTKHKLIMFGRTKFIEGIGRYNNILKDYPPTRMYQYIERVACAKNGNFSQKLNSVEANAWFVWDLDDRSFGDINNETTELHWIHRI